MWHERDCVIMVTICAMTDHEAVLVFVEAEGNLALKAGYKSKYLGGFAIFATASSGILECSMVECISADIILSNKYILPLLCFWCILLRWPPALLLYQIMSLQENNCQVLHFKIINMKGYAKILNHIIIKFQNKITLDVIKILQCTPLHKNV